jgi:hypothetical protein
VPCSDLPCRPSSCRPRDTPARAPAASGPSPSGAPRPHPKSPETTGNATSIHRTRRVRNRRTTIRRRGQGKKALTRRNQGARLTLSSSRSESHVVDICWSCSFTVLLIARGRASPVAPCKRDFTDQFRLRGNSKHSPRAARTRYPNPRLHCAGQGDEIPSKPRVSPSAEASTPRRERPDPTRGNCKQNAHLFTARRRGLVERAGRGGGGGLPPWRESRDPAPQGRDERVEWGGDGMRGRGRRVFEMF